MTKEETLVVIALVAAAIMARLYYVNFVKGGRNKKQKLIDKAKAAGTVVVGQCVASSYDYGNSASDALEMRSGMMIAKYAYIARNGKTYHKTLSFKEYGAITLACPGTVTIYYDPSNPKKCVSDAEVSRSDTIRSGCLSSIVVFSITLFAVFYVLRLLIL